MLKKISLFFLVLSIFCGKQIHAELLPLEDVIENVYNSVVNIIVDTKDNTQALGAGFVVGADGYVVTNAHVTDEADMIFVVTSQNKSFSANLIGMDKKTDVALLKIDHPDGLEPARFGDSDAVRVGNRVFAIGNPFGLGNSVSLGIISAKERDIEKGPYDNFLQTDAAISQGNSGGPLFNLNGEIIGMNTAIFSTDGKFAGVGFATPSNIVQWIVTQLKQNRKVIRGWLGIRVKEMCSTDTTEGPQLLVETMVEGSPAEKAGFKVGDVIKKAGDISLKNPRTFSLELSKKPPKTIIPFLLNRDTEEMEVSVEVAQMPDDFALIDGGNRPKTNSVIQSFKSLGIDKYKVKDAEDFNLLGVRAYFDEINREFVIVAIDKLSEIASKGIKIGDRFVRVDGHPLFGIEDLKVKIKQAQAKGSIQLLFMQNGEPDTVVLKLEANHGAN